MNDLDKLFNHKQSQQSVPVQPKLPGKKFKEDEDFEPLKGEKMKPKSKRKESKKREPEKEAKPMYQPRSNNNTNTHH